MNVIFGMDLDDKIYPMDFDKTEGHSAGTHYCGPFGMVKLLSKLLGIDEQNIDNPYLRMEQYRQLLKWNLDTHPEAFYARSFDADGLGTAKVLLNWRDELVLAGWNFEIQDQMPKRLKTLADVHAQQDELTKVLDRGFADRMSEILILLSESDSLFESVTLQEPIDHLPGHFQNMFQVLQSLGCQIIVPKAKEYSNPTSDLERFQFQLASAEGAKPLEASQDGSLCILRSPRDSDAALFVAQLLRLNPSFRPLCFLPDKSRTLDNACIQEDLPSMGIQTDSFARPTLQLLKLVGAFLWKPIDPFKIMEFVSLSIQPIWEELAQHIAETLAERPGIRGEFWQSRIAQFFAKLEERVANGEDIDLDAVRNEYRFWFGRNPHENGSAVAREEILEVFERLANWAKRTYDSGGSIQRSLKGLESQARKIAQLIASLPESEQAIDELRLERIVRTIYEASPVTFLEAQAHHLPYVHKPGAILEPLDSILWWNFTDQESDNQLPRWYTGEIKYLKTVGIIPDAQDQQTRLRIWHRQIPVFQAQKRLVLILPDRVEGQEKHPHPLFGDFQAAFSNWKDLVIDQLPQKPSSLLAGLQIPNWVQVVHQAETESQTFLNLNLEETNFPSGDSLSFREEESFSSLNSLFYYPYQWALRFKTKIRKSPVLSLVREETLKGNLAHRLFEKLFKTPNVLTWSNGEIDQFISDQFEPLLESEGLVLLLYGKEPEKEAFRIAVSRAIHTLLDLIRNNHWEIEGVEQAKEVKFKSSNLKGIADLVLRRGTEKAVVDLKWRGKSRYRDLIASQEDLQLAFYARMVGEDQWAHTAYFIIKDSALISRNNQAFKEAIAVLPDQDHRLDYEEIWKKMERTFDWRMEQLQSGKIELRTENTIHLLDSYYEDLAWEDLLAMQESGAYFDDYKALVDRIQ